MFYCDPCARDRKWPLTGFSSWGKCEVCGEETTCNDMPSKYLPVPEAVEPVETTTEADEGDRSSDVAKSVLDALKGYGGFDHWWDDIDSDLQAGIIQDLANVIKEAMA